MSENDKKISRHDEKQQQSTEDASDDIRLSFLIRSKLWL